MVGVRVDGPVRENDIRLLGGQQLEQVLGTLGIDLGRAINLPSEYSFGGKQLAGRLGLGRADRGRFRRR
jgi:hypothetical protein